MLRAKEYKTRVLQYSGKWQLYARLLTELEWKTEVRYFLEYSFDKITQNQRLKTLMATNAHSTQNSSY